MVRTWGGMILTIRKFFKAKTAFYEYWTSIKIKISMICVSKEVVNQQIFCWWGDSPIPPAGKTLYKHCQQVFIYNEQGLCTSHKSFPKVAILLLQDLSTLRVTDIYDIYFHLSVQCLQYNKFITSWTCLIRPNNGRSISQKSISH